MAQWNITHTCGHDETHQLYGPGKDREQRAKWLETILCSDCYRNDKQAQREQSQQIAAENNAESGLPALEGSEKQIKWAETIRASVKSEMDKCVAELVATEPRNDSETQTKAWALEDAKIILKQKRAAYWIDNRFLHAQDLLKRRHDKRVADQALGLSK